MTLKTDSNIALRIFFGLSIVFCCVCITDAESKYTYIAKDAFGRRVETLYPSGDYEHSIYNGDGTLSSSAVWDANDVKQWIDYSYDDYGRLQTVTYPDDGYITNSYDGFGRKTQVVDSRNSTDNIGGDGAISYEYDALGRTVKITDHDDWIIEYGYMSDGQKSQIKVTEPNSLQLMYHIAYLYDKALRLEYVSEPLLGLSSPWIAKMDYDDNGNRDELTYYRDGTLNGNTTAMSYTYNMDNRLTAFSTTGGVTFSLSNTTVDGLGRLISGTDTLNTKSHVLNYTYDMRSQLTEASVSNIGGSTWTADYDYRRDGNIDSETVAGTSADFDYDGDLMTDKGNDSLDWDLNGQLTSGIIASMEWNWDGKLQSASAAGTSIDLKYDPSGNRIYKSVDGGSATTDRKYIVDIIGRLPVILLELDTSENDPNASIDKTYIYAGAQVIAQHDGNFEDAIYFYLHDRLGSVRQIIDVNANVKNKYTYQPFGTPFASEVTETVTNPWAFTGQYYDSEIGQYYLRARQFDPSIYRFVSRDPYEGVFEKPGELHRYLYCLNNPINRIDADGRFSYGEVTVTTGIRGWLTNALTSKIIKSAGVGALTGATWRGLVGGFAETPGDWSWSGALSGATQGALYGAIGGGVSSGLASLSAGGYLFAAFEESAALQGVIAGGSAGLAEGAFKKEDLRDIFIRGAVGGVGGWFGGLLGEIEPPLSGIPGGVAGGQLSQFFYDYFVGWFGGHPLE